MSEEEDRLCRQLASVCDLGNEEEIDRFIELVSKLRRYPDVDVLRCMLKCFRDTDAGEVQYELVEAVEAYPDEVYVPVFLAEGIELAERSPEWFELLFQSILNSPRAFDEVKRHFQDLSPDKRQYYLDKIAELTLTNTKYSPHLSTLNELD